MEHRFSLTGTLMLAVACASLCPACFDISSPASYLCSETSLSCPSGQTCFKGKCVPENMTPDGAAGDLTPDLFPTKCSKSPETWVTIPAGSFIMGAPLGEVCREKDETQHKVTLTTPFLMQATEVTRAQFVKQMGFDTSWYQQCPMDCPVERVNWHGAAAYCNALSKAASLTPCYADTGSGKPCIYSDAHKTCESTEGCVSPPTNSGSCVRMEEVPAYAGRKIYSCPGYRLPTEAEWEYAYRAGTTTALYSGPMVNCHLKTDPNADLIGWYRYNSSMKVADGGLPVLSRRSVAQKKPNAFCLFDMAGNVWEWNNDWWNGSDPGSSPITDPVGLPSGILKSLRGGSYWDEPGHLRAADRLGWYPWMTASRKGFRCVRSVIKSK